MNSIRLVYLWEQSQLREQATTKDFFLVVRQEGKRAMSLRRPAQLETRATLIRGVAFSLATMGSCNRRDYRQS